MHPGPRTVIDSLADSAQSPAGLPDGNWSVLNDNQGLAHRVAEELAQAIITGVLPGGARLREPEIAAAFGVSRTPIREALYILERDSLVERPPRKSARVASVTAKQALDIYVCRAYLYGLSARMAATMLSEQGLDELGQIVEQMDAAVEANDIHAYYRLNLGFHDLIGRATQNDMLLRLMGGMGRLTLRFRFMSLTIPGRMNISVQRHHRLLSLLRERNGRAAELEVRSIVSGAGDAVLAHFFDDSSGRVTTATLEL